MRSNARKIRCSIVFARRSPESAAIYRQTAKRSSLQIGEIWNLVLPGVGKFGFPRGELASSFLGRQAFAARDLGRTPA